MSNEENDLDAGMKCIKYMIFVTNFMFLMVGFLLISIGTTVVTIYSDFNGFLDEYYFSPAKLTTAIGIIILLVSFFGCIGALKQSTCLINMFALALFLILILEYSAAIAAYVARNSIEESIENSMEETIGLNNSDYAQETWDTTQKLLKCCGVHNYSDWEEYGKSIPDSCHDSYNYNNIYTRGCLDILTYVISEFSLLITIGCLCISIIQILGIVFAQMLAKSIRKVKTQILVRRQENRKFYEQLAYGGLTEKKPVVYTPSGSSDA